VPCLRRATALAYTDADEDAERLLAIGDLSSTGSEADEWVETHTGRPSAHDSAGNAGVIDDIPDLDGAGDVATSPLVLERSLCLGRPSAEPAETPDLDDIPDMEEDLEEGDDEATAAPPKPTKGSYRYRVRRNDDSFLLVFTAHVFPLIVRSKWPRETYFKCEPTML
jgi:ubiquitin-like-conjugating enzyme ATG3